MDDLRALSQIVAPFHRGAEERGILREGMWDLDRLRDTATELIDDYLRDPTLTRNELVGTIHSAALAIALGPRPLVYQMRHGAARRVSETDLYHVPTEPPAFLRRSWIAEVRQPGREALYGDVVGLGYYPLPEMGFLVSLSPGRVAVYPWRPRWSGEEIASGIDGRGVLVDDFGRWSEDGAQAARFALVLGLLLEADSTPLQVENKARKRSVQRQERAGREARAPAWSVRHIYLDPKHSVAAERHDRRESSADGTTGRVSADVQVRGHLKRQRYGPGRSATRWIYVAGYAARRWVAPRPVRVVVHGPEGE